jgi:hypothetical protein
LQKVMQEIFTQVYAIENDVKILKAQSDNFESLRRNYTLRRENDSFYLELHNCQKQILETLKSLGLIISNQKIEI